MARKKANKCSCGKTQKTMNQCGCGFWDDLKTGFALPFKLANSGLNAFGLKPSMAVGLLGLAQPELLPLTTFAAGALGSKGYGQSGSGIKSSINNLKAKLSGLPNADTPAGYAKAFPESSKKQACRKKMCDLGIKSKSDANKWNLKNHPDKGGNPEIFKKNYETIRDCVAEGALCQGGGRRMMREAGMGSSGQVSYGTTPIMVADTYNVQYGNRMRGGAVVMPVSSNIMLFDDKNALNNGTVHPVDPHKVQHGLAIPQF